MINWDRVITELGSGAARCEHEAAAEVLRVMTVALHEGRQEYESNMSELQSWIKVALSKDGC